MTTVGEAFAGPDSAYFGDSPDDLILASMHRDSDTITRSNYAAARARAEAAGLEPVEITAGHWLVGRVFYLTLEPSEAARALITEITGELEDYPVLDEGHLSELEWTEGRESLALRLSDHFDRETDLLLDPDFRDRVLDTLSEMDDQGYWVRDLAIGGNWPHIFKSDRGHEDRATLAAALRHARHSEESIYGCTHCD